jgi:hypothetical protein
MIRATIHANASQPSESTSESNPDDPPYAPQTPIDYTAYYPLDGNANDLSGNGLDGSVQGGSFTDGKVAGALSFDGVDDYVAIEDDPLLDITDALTLAAWVKPEQSQDDYARIISRERSGAGNRQYNLGVDASADDPRTVVDTESADGVEVSAVLPFADNNWHHVAMSFDSSDKIRLYVDGSVADSTGVSAELVSRDSQVTLGAPAHLPGKDHFAGLIDDVRIYDRALTPSEVQAFYNDA